MFLILALFSFLLSFYAQRTFFSFQTTTKITLKTARTSLHIRVRPYIFACTFSQNRRWKLGQQNAICWNYLRLFRDYGLDHIFLGIKLHLFEKEFHETSQNFNSIRQPIEKLEIKIVLSWMSWNFERFHELIFFKWMLKVSAFYLEKQKSFIPKKIWSKP